MAKILIVDDEPLTVQMLTTFLSMSGYESTGALSRSQTWDKLAYEEPDVILLDIMLPDGNGIEICRELRAQEKWKDVPVIMISAHSPPMSAEATEAGATGYLTKPINFAKLKETLAALNLT